jgi:hypothetical protein
MRSNLTRNTLHPPDGDRLPFVINRMFNRIAKKHVGLWKRNARGLVRDQEFKSRGRKVKTTKLYRAYRSHLLEYFEECAAAKLSVFTLTEKEIAGCPDMEWERLLLRGNAGYSEPDDKSIILPRAIEMVIWNMASKHTID